MDLENLTNEELKKKVDCLNLTEKKEAAGIITECLKRLMDTIMVIPINK